MTIAIIVQARIGSTRMPGKVLQELAGRTVLHHVLTRCQKTSGVDVVVCAVPDDPASVALEAVATEVGAVTFRGSETDVLDRYLGAARAVGADVIMRVTSDCPLIDPKICGDVLELREREGAGYATNNMPRSFPLGLDCEAFTIAALAEATANANDPYDREHVTPWLRRAAHVKRVNLSLGNPALATYRWTLDYPEDLEFFRAVFAALPPASAGLMADVLAVLSAHPDIIAINASRSQVAVG